MRTATNGYTAIDSDGKLVITCMTREQAAALVNTMQANGVSLHIHPTLDDTDGSCRWRTNGYTAIDNDGNVMIACMTREQAAAMVNTMQANGVSLHIHPALDDTDGSRRRRWFLNEIEGKGWEPGRDVARR